jgi:hypothetical protein
MGDHILAPEALPISQLRAEGDALIGADGWDDS